MQGNVVAAARWVGCSIILASAILVVGFHPRVQQWGEPASQPSSTKESVPQGEERQEESAASETTEADTSPAHWSSKLCRWFGPGNVAGMTLPSPWYLQHPPQYIPPSPIFPSSSEVAAKPTSEEPLVLPEELKQAAPR